MPRPLDYQTLDEPLRPLVWNAFRVAFLFELIAVLLPVFYFRYRDGILGEVSILEESVVACLPIALTWIVCVPWFLFGKPRRSFPTGFWIGLQCLRGIALPFFLIPFPPLNDPDGLFSDVSLVFIFGGFQALLLVPIGCFTYMRLWEKRARLEKCKSN